MHPSLPNNLRSPQHKIIPTRIKLFINPPFPHLFRAIMLLKLRDQRLLNSANRIRPKPGIIPPEKHRRERSIALAWHLEVNRGRTPPIPPTRFHKITNSSTPPTPST